MAEQGRVRVRPALQLVRSAGAPGGAVSVNARDTVRCLRALLEEAERGEIQGISFAVMKSNRDFTYNSCGEAHRNPAWAAAMAATLMHGTMKRIFGEDA